jgi:predicted nuclease with TOPRIM domain
VNAIDILKYILPLLSALVAFLAAYMWKNLEELKKLPNKVEKLERENANLRSDIEKLNNEFDKRAIEKVYSEIREDKFCNELNLHLSKGFESKFIGEGDQLRRFIKTTIKENYKGFISLSEEQKAQQVQEQVVEKVNIP